jgi:hypothetical protein
MGSTDKIFDNNRLTMDLSQRANDHNSTAENKQHESVNDTQTRMPKAKIESELGSLNNLKMGKYMQPRDGKPGAIRCTRNLPLKWQRKILKSIRRDDITVENAPALYLSYKKLGQKIPRRVNKIMTKHKLKKIGFTPADSITSWSLLFTSEPAAERYKVLWQTNNPQEDFDLLVRRLNSSASQFYESEKERTATKRQADKQEHNDSSSDEIGSDYGDNDSSDTDHSDSENSNLSLPRKKPRANKDDADICTLQVTPAKTEPVSRADKRRVLPAAQLDDDGATSPYTVPPRGPYNAFYRPPPHPVYGNRRLGANMYPPYDPYYNYW